MSAWTDPRFWDGIAESYALKPLSDPDATRRKLDVVRQHLGPTTRLLDVGCGTGTIALDLAPSAAEVHGLDLSPGMIDIARRKTAAAGVPNVRFHVAPADTLSGFEDGAFQVVSAFNILHLVEEPDVLLASIARVLAPGGVFVTSTPCLGGTWLPPYPLMLPVLRWLGRAPRVTLISPDGLVERVKRAGFVDIEHPDVGCRAPNVFLLARRPRS
ncbi:MAG: class I SAM-dependent methyltransferase [Alphaproteobacteria bacterium]|nr:class I SAM-dependent methyltransferase [Alphaproteobacteria bacterium]MCB9699383.1 class I SAM-dependent methyltransferase [Alphaproteobacteria bacterium]